MDYDSSSKFISSLAKFLQSLCNGYVEFDSGVQVIGHLYLSVDTGKTIDYILNEKVCKTDENSVTFISNSFHAQPAEKPKAPGKKPGKDSDKSDLKSEQEAEVAPSQAEPRSTNVGTLPAARNTSQNSHTQGTKRPFSPSHKSHSKSGRSSPRNKKNRTDSLDQNAAHVSDPANESSVLSAPSPTGDSDSELGSGQGSAAPHGSGLNETYQQNYFNPDEENSLASESNTHDIKPSIDTDVTFIKEEYIPSSQSSGHGHDRSQGDESSAYPYQTNSLYPSNYASSGGYGTPQRSSYPSSHMYSPGHHTSLKNDDSSADPSGYLDGQALLAAVSDQAAQTLVGKFAVYTGTSGYARRTGSRSLADGVLSTCAHCGGIYTNQVVCRAHELKCNGLNRLMCHLCKRVYSQMCALKEHLRGKHGLGEMLVCKACGRSFKYKPKLYDHACLGLPTSSRVYLDDKKHQTG